MTNWILTTYLTLLVLTLLVTFFVVRAVVSAYLEFRGTRVITCPETSAPAAVVVDAKHAAATILHGDPELRLKSCTRWPERSGCDQECLRQIEEAPEDCLARTMLTNWYRGKRCAYCGNAFREIDWLDNQPALRGPGARTLQWAEVPAEKLPEILATHQPVCWNCHIAETFRREHPELVVDRPWKGSVVRETHPGSDSARG